MPHLIGHVDDSNGQLAHYNLLQTLHDFASENGWQVLRYNTDIENRELILKSNGYTGKEEIYLFFYCYQSATQDFYNLAVGSGIGYVPNNSITTQPNVIFSGVPTHNRRIDYWITLNPQRIAGLLRVGTPVYESFYIGKFLPYAMPNQYPLPLICAGMLDGTPSTRFSDIKHSMPYKGSRGNFRMWFNDGQWLKPAAYPWNNLNLTGRSYLRSCNEYYTLNRILLCDSHNIYGELDGVAHISGFDNVVENTLVIDGITWIVAQDVARTSPVDYYALKLED